MSRVQCRTGLARRASGSALHDAGGAGGRRSGRGAGYIDVVTVGYCTKDEKVRKEHEKVALAAVVGLCPPESR